MEKCPLFKGIGALCDCRIRKPGTILSLELDSIIKKLNKIYEEIQQIYKDLYDEFYNRAVSAAKAKEKFRNTKTKQYCN